jgi:hypothetical protein
MVLPPELLWDAARVRLLRAKDAFTKSAVAVLKGQPGCAEQATAALCELEAARGQLAALEVSATGD